MLLKWFLSAVLSGRTFSEKLREIRFPLKPIAENSICAQTKFPSIFSGKVRHDNTTLYWAEGIIKMRVEAISILIWDGISYHPLMYLNPQKILFIQDWKLLELIFQSAPEFTHQYKIHRFVWTASCVWEIFSPVLFTRFCTPKIHSLDFWEL